MLVSDERDFDTCAMRKMVLFVAVNGPRTEDLRDAKLGIW